MGQIPDGTIADFPDPAPWFANPPRSGAWKAALLSIIALALIVAGVVGLIVFSKKDMRAAAVTCMAVAGCAVILLPFTGAGLKRALNWRGGRILPARVLTPAINQTTGSDFARGGLRLLGIAGEIMAGGANGPSGQALATIEFVLAGRAYVSGVPLEGDVKHWKLDNIVWIVIRKDVRALSSCAPGGTQLAVPPDVELQLRQALKHLPRG